MLLVLIAAKYFPDIENIDNEDICPSMKDYDLDSKDAKELPFIFNENFDEGDDCDADYSVTDNVFGGDMDFDDRPQMAAFGEGGEAWMRTLADQGALEIGSSPFDPFKRAVELGFAMSEGGDSVFSYFDRSLSKSWAGPEHWKILRFKKDTLAVSENKKRRKEKEYFEIDFFADDVDTEELFVRGGPTLLLPKTKWVSKNRNLLPADTHFNSKQLLRLFTKPKAILNTKRQQLRRSSTSQMPTNGNDEYNMDEVYWARHNLENNVDPTQPNADEQAYDANFFQEEDYGHQPGFNDDVDDDDFADMQDKQHSFMAQSPNHLVNALSRMTMGEEFKVDQTFGEMGQTLVLEGQVRPDYINYAKRVKKVDVRKLKENIWDELELQGLHDINASVITSDLAQVKIKKKKKKILYYSFSVSLSFLVI